MISRRQFIQGSVLLSSGWLAGCGDSDSSDTDTTGTGTGTTPTPSPTPSPTPTPTTLWRMPDEAETHKRTWMAFGAQGSVWGDALLPEVRKSLITLAKTISRYEPVSMLVRESEHALAMQMLGTAAVELVIAPLDDLWIRDTGCLFVTNAQGGKAAVNFNFNGWGNKQTHANDAKVAALVAQQAGVELLRSSLIMEGGCIEVDGKGTAIITESCTLNDNRNPNVTKAQFEAALMPLLGLKKIIWLPGIKGKDITDGHTDFYARFASPGVVLAGYDPDTTSFDHAVTTRHLELLKAATDAQGNRLEVITLTAPTNIRPALLTNEFAAGYIGFYACNNAIIMQEFGDATADAAAKAALQRAFPNRTIEQINVDGIAAGGGSIHCATQQELAV